MVNDRMMVRVAMLFALAALPSLANSQAMKSDQSKFPDWKGKEVTQITIDGSYQQLNAFKEGLPTAITKGLAEQTIVLSASGKKKLVYSYVTETGESTVSGFYSALKSSSEKAKAQRPPVMHTSIFAAFPCRIGSCGGQLSWIGPRPPCPC
jgi:ABC-type phosphate transport system substrate-binding protein